MAAKLQQESPKTIKRFRSAFTTDQVNYLEHEFRKCPYIGKGQRKEVAIVLNIPERAVKIWFQNRRMKEKKDANNKDYVDEQTIKSYKDQLFNVGTMQSTNEQPPRSLPLLTTTIDSVNKSNIDNNTEHKRYRVVIKRPAKSNYYEKCHNKNLDIEPSTAVNQDVQNNIPEQGTSPLDCKSEECSINFCKRNIKECDNGVKFDDINLRTQKCELDTPVHKRKKYQESPEDLSSKKQNVSQEEPKRDLRNPPCFPLVSSYYQQSFMPPGDVVWKPISVMPIKPTHPSPMTLSANHSGNLSIVQEQNVQKKNCNCDCHAKTYPIPIAFRPDYQSPQYLLTAVPIQNSSPKL